MRGSARLVTAVVAALLALSGAGSASEPLWTLLEQGGQVVLMRHATAVAGLGDPPGMRLDECRTQRNLSDQGRQDACRIGEVFRARGIPVDRVLSSPWCRCLETARLSLGSAGPWDALGNVLGRPERRGEQVARLTPMVEQRRTGGNLVLVSQALTIAAVTGVSPGTGEMVIVTPMGDGRFTVAGRLTAH